MLGTVVNAAAVVAGGFIGLLLKRGISEKVSDAIMKGIALCIMYVGISGALKGTNQLVAIISVAAGAVVGALLDLDARFERFGRRVEARLSKNGGGAGFSEGMITASLLFCVGAMAVVGSLDSGLTGNHSTLYTKSLLDFISSIVLAASLGVGVLFSAVFILIYQGAITLLASVIAPVLNDEAVAAMTCVGSILIIGLSLNMLGLTKIKVMNYVPCIFLAIGISYLAGLISI